MFPIVQLSRNLHVDEKKTTAILNKALPPECLDYLKNHCKTHPFFLGTDGSNDTGILKMNPVSLRILGVNASKITTDHFLMRF